MVEFIENGLSKDRQILPTYQRQWALQNCSDRLQNTVNTAQNCLKRVRPDKESNNSATVSHRITNFCKTIHAYQIYSQAGYDATRYFRLALIEVQKTAKMPPPTAMGRILVAHILPAPPIGGLLVKC